MKRGSAVRCPLAERVIRLEKVLGSGNDGFDGRDGSADEPRLEFNFERVKKKDIYRELVLLYYSRHFFAGTVSDLIRFLAAATNLGSESAVRKGFYDVM